VQARHLTAQYKAARDVLSTDLASFGSETNLNFASERAFAASAAAL
jgi:hypothetical protein